MNSLLQEFVEKKSVDIGIYIKQRVKKEDFETVAEYTFSDEEEVRILVAECLGEIAVVKGLKNLEILLEDKKYKVRVAAAKALGEIREKIHRSSCKTSQ